MENIKVADVMTRDPVVVKPETSLLECAKKMIKKRIGILLLADKKKLVGTLSEKDILWVLVKKSKADLSKIRAVDVSSRKIAVIKPTATIKEALEKMKKSKFRRLPVIQEGNLVGIVTIKDILTFHPEFYPELEEFAQIKEEENKLKRIKRAKESSSIKDGICEECGEWGLLYRINGMLVCESCKNSM